MINFSIPRFSLPHKNLHSAQRLFGKVIKIFKIPLLLVLLITLSLPSLIARSTVFASHTTLLVNANGSSIPQIINSIPGGLPFTVKLVVANFDIANGLGAFEVDVTFDNNYLWIPSSNGPAGYPQGNVTEGSFLSSTGKGINCRDHYIFKVPETTTTYTLRMTCFALGPTPGPYGSGAIMNITFTPTSLQYGPYYGIVAPIDISASSLVNTSQNPERITHTQIDGVVQFAKCANLDGFPAVGVSDIARIVQLFGTTSLSPSWNPNADLNFDNVVGVQDISIIVKEFGRICPS